MASYSAIRPLCPTAAFGLFSSCWAMLFSSLLRSTLKQNHEKKYEWKMSHLDRVSLIDMDMSNSCPSFCFPKATAPLVTTMHSLPWFWISAI